MGGSIYEQHRKQNPGTAEKEWNDTGKTGGGTGGDLPVCFQMGEWGFPNLKIPH